MERINYSILQDQFYNTYYVHSKRARTGSQSSLRLKRLSSKRRCTSYRSLKPRRLWDSKLFSSSSFYPQYVYVPNLQTSQRLEYLQYFWVGWYILRVFSLISMIDQKSSHILSMSWVQAVESTGSQMSDIGKMDVDKVKFSLKIMASFDAIIRSKTSNKGSSKSMYWVSWTSHGIHPVLNFQSQQPLLFTEIIWLQGGTRDGICLQVHQRRYPQGSWW